MWESHDLSVGRAGPERIRKCVHDRSIVITCVCSVVVSSFVNTSLSTFDRLTGELYSRTPCATSEKLPWNSNVGTCVKIHGTCIGQVTWRMVNLNRFRRRNQHQAPRIVDKPERERHYLSIIGSVLSCILLIVCLCLKEWANAVVDTITTGGQRGQCVFSFGLTQVSYIDGSKQYSTSSELLFHGGDDHNYYCGWDIKVFGVGVLVVLQFSENKVVLL